MDQLQNRAVPTTAITTTTTTITTVLLPPLLHFSIGNASSGTLLYKSQNLMDVLQANVVDFRVRVNLR